MMDELMYGSDTHGKYGEFAECPAGEEIQKSKEIA